MKRKLTSSETLRFFHQTILFLYVESPVLPLFSANYSVIVVARIGDLQLLQHHVEKGLKLGVVVMGKLENTSAFQTLDVIHLVIYITV